MIRKKRITYVWFSFGIIWYHRCCGCRRRYCLCSFFFLLFQFFLFFSFVVFVFSTHIAFQIHIQVLFFVTDDCVCHSWYTDKTFVVWEEIINTCISIKRMIINKNIDISRIMMIFIRMSSMYLLNTFRNVFSNYKRRENEMCVVWQGFLLVWTIVNK